MQREQASIEPKKFNVRIDHTNSLHNKVWSFVLKSKMRPFWERICKEYKHFQFYTFRIYEQVALCTCGGLIQIFECNNQY